MGFRVGFALTKKKRKSFIQPSLLAEASKRNIDLIQIDEEASLVNQGPFDAILHKIPGKRWREELEAYGKTRPEVFIIDPPAAIEQLHNRRDMLQAVADLDPTNCGGEVRIPRQLVVTCDAQLIQAAVEEAQLKLPLVAKPLVADGTARSHDMSLAHDLECLSKLDPPLVLQEFVNHGGVLFKVYVVGELVRVVQRPSLPDLEEGGSEHNGVQSFARVSSAAALASDDANQKAEYPPRPILKALAAQLRSKLGLHLFNLDIIRENGIGDKYYVIDINYFPGYAKMPDYEDAVVSFLESLAKEKGS